MRALLGLLVCFLWAAHAVSALRLPHVVAIVASQFDESESANEVAGPEAQPSKPNTAGLQFMITKKMRGVLLEELGYLPDEVDVMEPQIATVVIERSLRRPAKGIPSSWRRPEAVAERRRRELARYIGNIQTGVSMSADFFRLYVRPLAPYIVGTSVVWFQRDSITVAVQSLLQCARAACAALPRLWPLGAKKPSKHPRGGKAAVSLESLNRAWKPSLWDRWGPKRHSAP